MTKKCKDCHKVKQQSDFYGAQGECKECTAKRIKKSSRNIKLKCLVCKKTFGTCKTEIRRGRGKFCSRKCFYEHNQGANVYNYQKYKVSYMALHKWVTKKLGRPNYCEHCKSSSAKKYEWSNVSGKYLRDVRDWQRLCKSCHVIYDQKEREVSCAVCGKKVKTLSGKRKFCTKRCSTRHYRSLSKQ